MKAIPPANSGLKLVKIVETDLHYNSVLTSNLNYTNDQITLVDVSESTGNTYKTEFVYENQRLARENHFENNSSSGYIILNYTGDRVTSTSSREGFFDYGMFTSTTAKALQPMRRSTETANWTMTDITTMTVQET